MRSYRIALLFAVGAWGGLGALSVACSSKDSGGFGNGDAGDDATADVATEGGKDGGKDVVNDTGGQDVVEELQGNCEPVQGACDLVLQNCPQNQECIVAQAADGGYTTECQNTPQTEHLPKGAACQPAQPSQNPCLRGLECLQNRCAPHCCQNDDTPCGQSTPEGYPGQCNLSVTGQNNEVLFYACTYANVCKPFQVLPCGSGSGCYGDQQGNFKCSQYANPNNPKQEGQACQYLNDCVDGTQCIGTQDGGSACTMLCYTGQGSPPFDAGALQMGPGTGGCSGNKKCNILINGWPNWVGACGP